MIKILILWWVLAAGVAGAALIGGVGDLLREKRPTLKAGLLVLALGFVTAGVLLFPDPLDFDLSPWMDQTRLGESFLLLAAGAASLLPGFKSGSGRRLKRYEKARRQR